MKLVVALVTLLINVGHGMYVNYSQHTVRILKLNLSNQNIYNDLVLKERLENFTELKELDLSANLFTEVPIATITVLPKLKRIFLDNNLIRKLPSMDRVTKNLSIVLSNNLLSCSCSNLERVTINLGTRIQVFCKYPVFVMTISVNNKKDLNCCGRKQITEFNVCLKKNFTYHIYPCESLTWKQFGTLEYESCLAYPNKENEYKLKEKGRRRIFITKICLVSFIGLVVVIFSVYCVVKFRKRGNGGTENQRVPSISGDCNESQINTVEQFARRRCFTIDEGEDEDIP
ncbi:uncharacterized protein LOC130614436 [Hydractinia symbiolongicarpus]|uniref:uncharacterized protein LOC130614436 n=1 Tax=Hydractinia symbiolongicarpus TaxID=13093 RepID=UPI0025505EDE|nr:uncharacterized protein LOC130614436 [Hydractinia symbiolongicarpus]